MAARRDRSRGRQRRGRGFRVRSVAAPQPTPATGPELWVDLSNYTGQLTDQGCADLKAARVVGCIIQAVTGLDGNSYTRQQLDACVRNGLRIQGYVFPSGLAQKLPMFDGYAIEFLWLDVELPISIAGVNAALAECDAYLGRKVGVYGARWFWDQQGWSNLATWANRPLWNADYNHVPTVGAGFVPFGGWSQPAVSQYQGTTSIGAVHQIDLDVMNA